MADECPNGAEVDSSTGDRLDRQYTQGWREDRPPNPLTALCTGGRHSLPLYDVRAYALLLYIALGSTLLFLSRPLCARCVPFVFPLSCSFGVLGMALFRGKLHEDVEPLAESLYASCKPRLLPLFSIDFPHFPSFT